MCRSMHEIPGAHLWHVLIQRSSTTDRHEAWKMPHFATLIAAAMHGSTGSLDVSSSHAGFPTNQLCEPELVDGRPDLGVWVLTDAAVSPEFQVKLQRILECNAANESTGTWPLSVQAHQAVHQNLSQAVHQIVHPVLSDHRVWGNHPSVPGHRTMCAGLAAGDRLGDGSSIHSTLSATT